MLSLNLTTKIIIILRNSKFQVGNLKNFAKDFAIRIFARPLMPETIMGMDYGYGKYDYVALLGLQFPSYDCEGHKCPHHLCFISDWEAEDVLHQLGRTDRDEQRFYRQDSIIPVIEAYGLDKEKFWYAVVFVEFLTSCWAEQKGFAKGLPSALEQLTRMRDKIQGQHEFKVIIENKLESHTYQMAGDRLIDLFVQSIDELIKKERASNMADRFEIPIWRSDVHAKKTEMTRYAANMFKRLFMCLELPTIRSRNVKKKYRTIEGVDVLIKGRDTNITYDKNQLIAELIHFLDLTDNDNLDGGSIKGILKDEFDIGIL